jgi:hypothetical protein
MNKFFEGGHLHQNSIPEIAVELFTLNKYNRRSKEQQNASLMQDMVTQNYFNRFEEQKARSGDRGPLDSSEDESSDSSEDSAEEKE